MLVFFPSPGIVMKPIHLGCFSKTKLLLILIWHDFVLGIRAIPSPDARCSVCENEKSSTTLMIPATNVCPNKWIVQYSGYLMASKSNYGNFIIHVLLISRKPYMDSFFLYFLFFYIVTFFHIRHSILKKRKNGWEVKSATRWPRGEPRATYGQAQKIACRQPQVDHKA